MIENSARPWFGDVIKVENALKSEEESMGCSVGGCSYCWQYARYYPIASISSEYLTYLEDMYKRVVVNFSDLIPTPVTTDDGFRIWEIQGK